MAYRLVDGDVVFPGQDLKAGDEVDLEDYSQERIDELVRNGTIEADGDEDEEEFPRSTGGASFELSNGERVQGEQAALEAQAELDEG